MGENNEVAVHVCVCVYGGVISWKSCKLQEKIAAFLSVCDNLDDAKGQEAFI